MSSAKGPGRSCALLPATGVKMDAACICTPLGFSSAVFSGSINTLSQTDVKFSGPRSCSASFLSLLGSIVCFSNPLSSKIRNGNSLQVPRQSHSRSAKRLTAENNQRREKTWCTTHQPGLHYKCSSCWFKAFPYICPTCSCVLIIARTCSNWEGIRDTRNEITYLLLKLFHLKFDFYVFLPFISLLVSRNCKKMFYY